LSEEQVRNKLLRKFEQFMPNSRLTERCLKDAVKQLRSVNAQTANWIVDHEVGPFQAQIQLQGVQGFDEDVVLWTLKSLFPEAFIDEDAGPPESKCFCITGVGPSVWCKNVAKPMHLLLLLPVFQITNWFVNSAYWLHHSLESSFQCLMSDVGG
jgi:hypothetical protein